MAERMATDAEIHAMNDRERAEVIALCERVGYGFTIDVAVREWDAMLERQYGIRHHGADWLTIFAKRLRDEARPKKQKARAQMSEQGRKE